MKMKDDNMKQLIQMVNEKILVEDATPEQVTEKLHVLKSFLEMNGTIDERAKKYLESVGKASAQFIAMRKMDLPIDTAVLYPSEEEIEIEHRRHYSSGC